jgi:hypothetical protein
MTEAKPLPLSAEELERMQRVCAAAPDAIFVSSNEREWASVSRMLATITSLQAENAGWRAAHAEAETYRGSRDTNGTFLVMALNCFSNISKDPTSAGSALLKRLEDAERERDGWRSVVLEVAGMFGFREPLENVNYSVAECSSGGLAENFKIAIDGLRQNQRTPLDEMERLTALLDKTPVGDDKSRAAIQDAVVRLANTIKTPDTIRSQEKK